MTDHVKITEVGLRDGLQIEPRVVPTVTKLALARELIAAGVEELEVGSFVRADKVPQMADTDVLLPQIARETTIPLPTLVFNLRGAERALAAGARHVRLVVSASDGHSRANAGCPTAEALDRLEPTAQLLREHDVHIEGDVATAFVCPFDGDTDPKRVLDVIRRLLALGASAITVADTEGAAHPRQVRTLIPMIRREFGAIDLGLHLHNTWGMASANILEALDQGVRRFDSALGGVGGCPFAPGASGNIATDDLVHQLHREGLHTGIDVDRLVQARDHLQTAVGHPLESALARIPATPAQEIVS